MVSTQYISTKQGVNEYIDDQVIGEQKIIIVNFDQGDHKPLSHL